MAGLFNPAHIKELATSFLRRNDKINRLGNVASHAQLIPGTVAFWPMSAINRSSGEIRDIARGMDLTRNGNPQIGTYNDFLPYVIFDGTGDYYSRADELALRITGAETLFAAAVRGLTIMGWAWFNNAASSTESILSKWNAAGDQRSYRLIRNSSGNIVIQVSSAGTAGTVVVGTTAGTAGTGQWYFVAGRFVPSASLDAWIGQGTITKTTNTTSIPASALAGTADLTVGGNGAGGELITGRISLLSLSANALSDAAISAFHQQTKVLAGF